MLFVLNYFGTKGEGGGCYNIRAIIIDGGFGERDHLFNIQILKYYVSAKYFFYIPYNFKTTTNNLNILENLCCILNKFDWKKWNWHKMENIWRKKEHTQRRIF